MTSIEDEDEIFLHEYLSGIERNQRYAGTRFNRSGTMPQQVEQYLNEQSAVRTLQEECPHLSGELSKPSSDPPDVIIQKVNGKTIGVEVTELVNEEAIKANLEYYKTKQLEDFRYTNFMSEEGVAFFNNKLDYLINNKSIKLEAVHASNKYGKLILLIATNEHQLNEKLVARLLGDKMWTSPVFDEIYLQLGYKSVLEGVGYYPYFRLDTEARN